ncbi:aquaporin family protein [Sphingomonas sp. MA1305]|jgi:glycerol uptake facilitator-like aquaporin|uniref:MIP/aquaporin family protein n=1 Tax=unclassified Sphingomonas TaxID=196159 RepID=UPI0018DFF995|nr:MULTISPECIES: aquaporin [unclassified Sphingomonas]MBI0476976.1 aquaporin family protein [Sphingomonas sp. MA1305]MCP4025524.1 aquaporin family protein [Sphingomonas sp.]
MRFGKSLLAEFIGTFALIFIGAGAVIALSPNETVAVALAHGLTIMSIAYAFGNESGSYLNPALSLAVVIAGERKFAAAIPTILAQLAGGVGGGLALAAIYGAGAPHHLGATVVDLERTSLLGGAWLEALGTFLLANAVLNAAVRKTAGNLAPFAIGMTVALCIMAFGPVTGASLNPARTLGPAVAIGDYSQVGIYIVAQMLGAGAAALLYRFVWNRAFDADEEHVIRKGEAKPAF